MYTTHNQVIVHYVSKHRVNLTQLCNTALLCQHHVCVSDGREIFSLTVKVLQGCSQEKHVPWLCEG